MNAFKNPYLNAVWAEAYILVVVAAISLIKAPNTPDTVFDSVTALSMLALSAAVMGYLFVGEPLQLYLSGEKRRAVSFFMRTVACFGAITLAAIVLVRLSR